MDTERYSRQIAFPGIGKAGQEKLLGSKVAVVGLGALGSVISEELARAGVGFLRLADRDYVERSNLARQAMYTEKDADEQLPKAVAAANHIAEIDRNIQTESIITEINAANIEKIILDMDVVLDGTDNFELRALMNEACVKHDIPWVYGGALAATGAVMPVFPHEGPCFRCISPNIPAPGSYPTCATAGIINMASHSVASIEAAEAVKIMLGVTRENLGVPSDDVNGTNVTYATAQYLSIDLWNGFYDTVSVARDEDCPVCGKGIYEYLERGVDEDAILTMCTEGSFQITPGTGTEIALDALVEKLSKIGRVLNNPYLLRFDGEGVSFNLFRDGRAVIRDAKNEADARRIYSEYIGL